MATVASRALLFLVILGAVALALLSMRGLALGKCHAVPGIGAVWSLDDDMMITLRYARNLAEGKGLVWNEGERVEGITNLLWALLLALPHWFLSPERVALAAIVLNGALLVAALALTARLALRLGASSFAAGLAALALATDPSVLHWAVAGSEGILLGVLLLAIAAVVADPNADQAALARACVLGGVAYLVRPDAAPALAALFVGPIVGRLAKAGTRGIGIQLAALLATLPLCAIAFRLAYYGAPFPNTYYLKMTGWSGRTVAGLEYVKAWLFAHPVQLGLALLAPIVVVAARRRAVFAIAAAIVLHALYVGYAGGDELMMERFFVPVAPLLCAAALVGADGLARRFAQAPPLVARATAYVLPAAALAGGFWCSGILPGTTTAAEANRAKAEMGCVQLGYAIRANTQPDAKVAHFWAGATAYFSERYAIDFLGKCDPVIAHQEAKPGLDRPGHNKYDFGHSLALEPDVIVGGIGGAASREFIANWATGPYRVFTDLYRERTFTDRYVLVASPGLAKEYVDAIRNWHGVFVRIGSTKANLSGNWTTPR